MTSVSLFQFSLCFKSPRTPQKCGVFVCPFIWLLCCLFLSNIVYASETVELKAKLDSNLNATDQIKSSFGKYSIEAPDLLKNEQGKSDRIKVIRDKELKSAFEFIIDRDLDGDRNKIWPKGKERQRNEIKGYKGSVDALKGYKNQTHQIKWYLKIEDSFKFTKEFCHFFQLKAVGRKNVDEPILTLSGVVGGGKPQLQLRVWSGDTSVRHFLADWKVSKGRWLKCEIRCKYEKDGSFDFSIESMNGEFKAEVTKENFQTWREGFEFVRPKWGIYRSLASFKNQLNPVDSIYLNHFSIQKR